MRDGYGRDIHYLRVSATDRCNLRCGYCMPEEGVPKLPHGEVLRGHEIERLVRVMAGLGVNRVRLTGGEPLVRCGLPGLARAIRAIPGIGFLGLTTNGVLLEEMAGALCAAGVDGLNISIDTLDRRRYEQVTRRDRLDSVLRGLEAALALPFARVKVNCVLAPGSIPEDWLSVAALAKDRPLDVRLIEWMPMAGEAQERAPTAGEALAAIEEAYGPLRPAPPDAGGGPAEYRLAEGFAGRIGVIHAMSHSFCGSCNRLRLTATGDLKLCLFYDAGVALKPLLRGGASDEELAKTILSALQAKPKQHAGRVKNREEGSACTTIEHALGMYRTGG